MSLATNYSTIPEGVKEFYDRLHLAIAQPKLVHGLWAQKRPLPKGEGKQIKFRRYGKLARAKTPITDGVTGTGKRLSATDILATMQQYGDYILITDQVLILQPDPNIKDGVKQLSIQKGETMDELMRDVMLSGTSVYYANKVAGTTSVVSKALATDLTQIERLLDRADAMKITQMVNASTGVGTQPLDECYVAIMHTDCKMDYRAMTGFIKVEEYASTGKLMPGEFGAIGAIRCIATSMGKYTENAGGSVGATGLKSAGGSKIDLYETVIFAQEAYGDIPLGGYSGGLIVKAHDKNDTSDTSDPMNQRSTVAWKTFWTGRVLNDEWIYKYYHGVTA